MNDLELIKTFKIDGETTNIYKNNNNIDFPYHVEIGNKKIDFPYKPSKEMIEEKYITILADEMIEQREKEITNNINNINNANKKIQDLLDLGFTKERALMTVALTNQTVNFNGVSHEGQYTDVENVKEDEYER